MMNDCTINACKIAKENALYIQKCSSEQKNKMLEIMADALEQNADIILNANKSDLDNYTDKSSHFYDRLMLDNKRISDMAKSLRTLVDLHDPVGETIDEYTQKDGLMIKKVRVPFGVVGIIYEARPNVTVDAVGLCLKSGNSVVLRGGSDAICSNKALVDILKTSLTQNGLTADFIQLISDTSHLSAENLMKARGLIDVLLPRGSAKLIKSVTENSLVPVIETGSGNCHAYIHKSADLAVAKNIILNGKLSRPSVCNALESLVIDEEIADEYLPQIVSELKRSNVEIVVCPKAKIICPDCALACDDDFYTEFLSLKISIKIVRGVDEAIAHINKCSSSHSETIIASEQNVIQRFLTEVDSAAVYANASTRFTDGFEFGFGAEVGISTQKMHARGPMGLKELTSYKYQIIGNGQVRR